MTPGERKKRVLRSSVVSIFLLATQAHGTALVARLESGAVSVRYELPEDVSEMLFYVDSPAIRGDYWRLETASLQLRSDGIYSSGANAFAYAVATLTPNDRQMDRVYPSLVTFGGRTSLVNIDYIRARNGNEEVPIVVQNAYDPEKQACVDNYRITSDAKRDLPDTAGRYVLLGTSYEDCAAASTTKVPGIFVAADTSDALGELISSAFFPVYDRLREGFGMALAKEPSVFVAHQRTSTSGGFQAEAGWDSVISLRFFGPNWDALDEAGFARVLILLAHESTHLWIGKAFQITGESSQSWLHEGAAEYIAMRELLEAGLISPEIFRDRIQENLSGCSSGLGANSLMTASSPQGGGLVYDCGVFIQFVYDRVSYAQSGGQRSVTEIWRDLMANSLESGTRTITAEEFLASNSTAREILASALHGPQLDSVAILNALHEFGVDAALEDATASDTIMAALSGFFRADCQSGPWGFYTAEDHLVLDANATCQSIPAGFVLRYLQGFDVLEDAGRAFDSVSAACAAGGEVRMTGRTTEEPELTLECPGLVGEKPRRVVIRELPL